MAAAPQLNTPVSMVPTTITVAWIGNSLTDFNNLPSMFQNLSLHLPQPVDVQYRAVMPGGAALFDHANLSLPVGVETADMLSGPWDYVVLQDQSQTPGGGRNERRTVDAGRGESAVRACAHQLLRAAHRRRGGLVRDVGAPLGRREQQRRLPGLPDDDEAHGVRLR